MALTTASETPPKLNLKEFFLSLKEFSLTHF